MSEPNTQNKAELARQVEARHISVMRGIKQGALKGMVDNLVDSMAGPIAESIMKNLKENHPNMELLEPAVRSALSFIVIMGVAEMINFAAPMAGRTLPQFTEENAVDKGRMLSQWMREYAGEKVGEQLIEATLQVFPMVMAHFSDISNDDLKMILEEDEIDITIDHPEEKEQTEEFKIEV